MKLFSRNFQKGDFTEQTYLPGNPDRGWYQLYIFSLDESVDLIKLQESINAEDSLVLVIFDIGCYRDRDLDEAAMQYMREVLKFFLARDKEIILRITYDHEGKAAEREPEVFAQVKNHTLKIRELLEEFGSSIFIYQGILLGNRGDMLSSHFMERDKMRELMAILPSGVGEDTFFSVRKPSQIRNIYAESTLFGQGNFQEELHGVARPIGLFDDAILGSDTDFGTFAPQGTPGSDWESDWSRDKEMTFLDKISTRAPVGGEVIYGDGYGASLTPERLITELKRMHVTYLNRMHDSTVLNDWMRHNYMGRGPWMGISLYDYIGAHMGYRFLVRDVRITLMGKSDSEKACAVVVDIANVGFANLYTEPEVFLQYLAGNGEKGSKKMSCDLRLIDSGKKMTFTAIVGLFQNVSVNYAFYLYARRKRDGKVIYFANKMVGDSVYLGYVR